VEQGQFLSQIMGREGTRDALPTIIQSFNELSFPGYIQLIESIIR